MKYLRRLLSFFASRLIAFTAVVALLILAFYLAMNTANIYVLLGDGSVRFIQESVALDTWRALATPSAIEGERVLADF